MNITHAIGTYNSIPYLKLAIKSVRENCYYKHAPFIIFADGCTDGTNEWLESVKDVYNLTLIIESRCENSSNGFGMNRVSQEVKTEFINFLHADMYCAKNQDVELLSVFSKYSEEDRLVVTSHRIQPSVWKESSYPGVLVVDNEEFGDDHDNFNESYFLDYAREFSELNNVVIPRNLGCSYMIKKRDWDYIGGNDLRFKPNGFDDMDLEIRMMKEGYKFHLTSKSVVFHFGGRGGNGYFGSGLESRNTNNAIGESITSKIFLEKWGKFPNVNEFGMHYF